MRQSIETKSPLAVVTFALALALVAGDVLAQADAKAALPRTPDGHPDLSGTYDLATLTPLMRPAQYGDKQFLTPEEAKKIADDEVARMSNKGQAKSDPDRDAPPEGGAPPVGLDESFLESSGAGSVGGYLSRAFA